MKSFCTYCKSTDSKPLYPTGDIFGNEYVMHECQHCHAIFLSPQPDDELLAKAYDDSYYGTQKDKFNPLVEKAIDLFRYNRAKRLVKGLPEKAKILDIGCGNGKFLKYLLNFGDFQLHGVEMEGNSAHRAAQITEIQLNVGQFEDLEFEENSFDAISMFHVFEHLREPEKALTKISKILKDNGKLVISFPNINSYQAQKFKGNWLHLDPPRHLFFFKPTDFEQIMKSFGFKLERKKFLSLEQNPFGMVQSYLNTWSKKRELLYESLKGNKQYLNDISSLTKGTHLLFFMFSMPFFAFTDLFVSMAGKGATVEFTFSKKLIID